MIPETPAIHRYVPGKLRAWEAVYWLNRSFEAVLLSLERLERVGMFRMEYLNEWKIRLEHTRAEANEELAESLRDHEQEESFRFEQMQSYWDKLGRDPDDVFFAARNRKQEIKEHIKDLESGLDRQRPKKNQKLKKKKPRR